MRQKIIYEKEAIFCDKCGDEIPNERYAVVFEMFTSLPKPNGNDAYKSKIDLCEACYDDLKRDFINFEDYKLPEKH